MIDATGITFYCLPRVYEEICKKKYNWNVKKNCKLLKIYEIIAFFYLTYIISISFSLQNPKIKQNLYTFQIFFHYVMNNKFSIDFDDGI